MADEQPEALAVAPQSLTYKCLEICPDAMPCALPEPFPKPQQGSRSVTKKAR